MKKKKAAKSLSPVGKTRRSKSKKKTVQVDGKRYTLYRPADDPAFFEIFVEKEHVDHLARKDLDVESKLHVIYRILKD